MAAGGSQTIVEEQADNLVEEQRALQARGTTDRAKEFKAAARRVSVFAAFLGFLALLYSAYRALGRALDHAQADWPIIGSFLPRSDDLAMPPIGDIVAGIGATQRGTGRPLGLLIAGEALSTLREAAIGFVVGAVLGLAIAIVLERSRLLERGLLPYVIGSQTIPLVAIAPIVVIWAPQSLDGLPWTWTGWMSVSIITTYLTFFPVAVNGLRGLQSPRPEDVELMRSYAAGWLPTLWRLRLPASLPYLFAAFKIAATISVVGAIVGEISGGVNGGLGRRILLEAQRYTTGPERLYVAVLGAAATGILVFLVISLLERLAIRGQKGVL